MRRALDYEWNEKKFKLFYVLTISLVVLLSLNGLVHIGSFTGYATHEAEAGSITELNIEYRPQAIYWAGIYGIALRYPGLDLNQSRTVAGGDMQELNLLFDCIPNEGRHELYASQVPPEDILWDTLQPATQGDIDNYIQINNDDFQSATKTYTEILSVSYGSNNISDVPGAYTYVYDKQRDATVWDTGILKDANGEIVIFSHISNNFTWGFNNQLYKFQMLVPVVKDGNQEYHFSVDPNNDCPTGYGELPPSGLVTGLVMDESGNALEGAIVNVAAATDLSDERGNYTVEPEIGEQHIWAVLTGYNVYHSTLNVSENETVIHNIVLTEVHVKDDEKQEDMTQVQINPNINEMTSVANYQIQAILEEPKKIEGADYIISINEIKRKLREGNYMQQEIFLISYQETTAVANFEVEGEVADMIQLDKEEVYVNPNAKESVTVTLFGRRGPGVYNGSIEITGDLNASIPVEIEILDKDKLPVEAMLIEVDVSERSITSGRPLKFETHLRNLLSEETYPVKLFYTVQSSDGKETIWTHDTNIFLTTAVSLFKEVELPKNLAAGDYVLTVSAEYLGLSAASSTVFFVTTPWYRIMLFGVIPIWWLFIFVAFVIGSLVAYIFIKRNMESKKKFHLKVDYNELPKPGATSIFVGKIAETDHKCYFDMEKFKVHTIVAGSTGGGKSFSAQGIIEEMLLKNVAIIVFDPTAQWTGMLRKMNSKFILGLYPDFGMKKTDARAFPGNIKQVEDKRELIDIKKYMKPGEIQVFACHRLDPKDMDMFIANVIREVFHANFDESPKLRLMLVFDEVHRLLPKFGGSGDGFLQIERGCREFRKWGIGIMLISQVLADFVGQIKANINTEIQMRTRDEGDLERIRVKYGEEVLRSLVKATVGAGMVENPAWNRGQPFFVQFRPLLHSVERLSDEEVEKYTKYNYEVDNLFYSLEQLEKENVDVFDLKLELKLAQDKIKSGNFNMVEIYLEGLRPRIDKHWEKLGKKPKKYELKLVSEAEMQEALQKAKQSRDEYIKQKGGKAGGEGGGEEEKPKSPEDRFKSDVPPDQILNLANGMIVINGNNLFDELAAMKKEDFEKDVNPDKNKIADWVRDAMGDKELAESIKNVMDKEQMQKIVGMRKNGEKLPPPAPPPKKEAGGKEGAEKKNAGDKEGEKQEADKEGENKEGGEQKQEADKEGENKEGGEQKQEAGENGDKKEAEAADGNQKAEDSKQDDGGQKAEDSKQDDGGQEAEDSKQEAEDSKPGAADGGQKADDSKQTADDSGQNDGGQEAEDSKQDDGGQKAEDSKPGAADGGQNDGGQKAEDSKQEAEDSKQDEGGPNAKPDSEKAKAMAEKEKKLAEKLGEHADVKEEAGKEDGSGEGS